VTVFEIVAF